MVHLRNATHKANNIERMSVYQRSTTLPWSSRRGAAVVDQPSWRDLCGADRAERRRAITIDGTPSIWCRGDHNVVQVTATNESSPPWTRVISTLAVRRQRCNDGPIFNINVCMYVCMCSKRTVSIRRHCLRGSE